MVSERICFELWSLHVSAVCHCGVLYHYIWQCWQQKTENCLQRSNYQYKQFIRINFLNNEENQMN